MKFRQEEDLFLHRQPKMSFIEDLTKPCHEETPPRWNERAAKAEELPVKRMVLRCAFPDPEGLLETAYADFRLFLKSARIVEAEDGYALETLWEPTACREAYRISVSDEGCRIFAADTEGVRRALIYLEDEMHRRGGAFLPIGEIARKPFIKTRMSRCFFTPPSHASNEGMVNELASDIDYYPDGYLNRLAHDGINALWLGASFRDLLSSEVIPEYGQDSERRIKKLNEVIEKCRRYGIAIYLFCIEPASTFRNPVLLEKHPDMLGGAFWGEKNRTFCLSTEGGMAYVREAFSKLFTLVPKLGGLMMITAGEANCCCGSIPRMLCPRCRERFGTVGRTLADFERVVLEIMKEKAPRAQFISWTYSQRAWKPEDIADSCEHRVPGVIHMQNFEDFCEVEQLGKNRLATDYWLSVVGPGRIFAQSLEINRRRGIETFAKIQACSSHEISTVPYVPAPGILYDKYKFMHENGVSGVVQCWYFGNYPCLMNKAACELAFEPFFPKKEDFLRHLAGVWWGEDADAAVAAWQHIEAGYRNFPVSMSFEWLGPMQDSPVSPYRLKPIDQPMASTWLLKNPSGGDRIGECLLNGHTEEEAILLCERMCEECRKGADTLAALPDYGNGDRREQQSVAKALALIFESGLDTLRFYALRRRLGIGTEEALPLLAEMERLVRREIEISRALIPICGADPRIGYHSEAHGYKIFPEKLYWRIGEMEKLLDGEFREVRKRVAHGLFPLAFYRGEEGGRSLLLKKVPLAEAEWLSFLTEGDGAEDSTTAVRGVRTEEGYTLQFRLAGAADSIEVHPEFRMFHPTVPFSVCAAGVLLDNDISFSIYDNRAAEERRKFSLVATEGEGYHLYTLSFRRADFGMEEAEPFRLYCKRTGTPYSVLATGDRIFSRLILNTYSTDAYAFFVPVP